VVNAKSERKLRKEVQRRFLQAAQLPAKERDENASPMPHLWSRGFVLLKIFQQK